MIATFMRDPSAGRGVAAHGVHPQQRRSRTACRASRSSRTAARTSAARCSRTGRSSTSRKKTIKPRTAPPVTLIPTHPARLRLPVPRRPVRHRGQPHRRPARARARPLRVRDRNGHLVLLGDVQRRARRRHRRGREDHEVHARPARASTSTASRAGSTRCSRRTDGDDRRQEEAGRRVGSGRDVPARLARGALGPRRRRQVLPLPQGPVATSAGSTRSARRR